MNERIKDKIVEIERYLEELESVLPQDFEEYEGDFKTRAACERYFEKIVEGAVDLAFLVIKHYGFKAPEDDKGAFDTLASEKVISEELASKLKDAKGMRNILAHEYGKVNDKTVFDSVTKELVGDAREFIECVKASES